MPSILFLNLGLVESERQTRKKRIDPLLKSLGWKIVPFNPSRPLGLYENCAIEEYPTATEAVKQNITKGVVSYPAKLLKFAGWEGGIASLKYR
jgi:hypothetical protein